MVYMCQSACSNPFHCSDLPVLTVTALASAGDGPGVIGRFAAEAGGQDWSAALSLLLGRFSAAWDAAHGHWPDRHKLVSETSLGEDDWMPALLVVTLASRGGGGGHRHGLSPASHITCLEGLGHFIFRIIPRCRWRCWSGVGVRTRMHGSVRPSFAASLTSGNRGTHSRSPQSTEHGPAVREREGPLYIIMKSRLPPLRTASRLRLGRYIASEYI